MFAGGFFQWLTESNQLKIACINVISILAIALFSGSWKTALVLSAYTVVTFFYIRFLATIVNINAKKVLFYGYFLLHIAVFLFFQTGGYIGILNTENATSPKTLAVLIGFAFYILQSLAICRAVYRKVIDPLDFQRYTLAISFCGAFLAGPLFNQDQLKLFRNLRVKFPTLDTLYNNSHLFIGALLFKYVFANWLARWVDITEVQSPLGIAKSILAFEFQVYFDFAGYSLLSLFLCRLFNIPMYFNFMQPFSAKDIPEFWRRWHVGLGTWFKENIYIPLKERFPQKWATKAAIPLFVFLASAMWHGPTKNFLLWGLFHGLAFAVSVNLLSRFDHLKLGRYFSKIFFLAAIFYGRLLFMDSDFSRLVEKFRVLGMFRRMATEFVAILPKDRAAFEALFYSNWDDFIVGGLIASAIVFELMIPRKLGAEPYPYFRPGFLSVIILVVILLCFQPVTRAGFVYGR